MKKFFDDTRKKLEIMTDEELAKNEFDKDEIKKKIVPTISESTTGPKTDAPIIR